MSDRPSITVVGLGATGRRATRALLERGATSLHLVDHDDIDAAGFVAESSASFPSAEMTLHTQATITWDGPWFTGSALCILAGDSVDASHCLALNAACQAAEITLLPGLGMGEVAQVGPLITPGGGGPCLQCIDIRVRAALGRPALAGPFSPNPTLADRVGTMLADMAMAFVAGQHGENPLGYVWEDGRSTFHHSLRTVHCPACGCCAPRPPYAAPNELPLAGAATPDLSRILTLQPFIVDEIAGIVRWISAYPLQPGDPLIAHSVASVADPVWSRLGQEVFAGGNDLDAPRALGAALGEALDRVCGTAPSPDHVRVATYDEVAGYAVAPERFDLFHAETRRLPGFPYPDVAHDIPMSWVWGWSWAEARPILVPAAQVFVPFAAVSVADRADVPNVSGFATGPSPATAALSGLLEVIERDTFMIAWATGAPLRRLAIGETSGWEIGAYVEAFNRVGVEVRCSTITLDWGVPVVIAIARPSLAGEPAAVVAAAADPDVAHACRRALKELSANLANVRGEMQRARFVPGADPSMVRTEDAHGLLFAQPAMAHHLAFWWDPPETIALGSPDEIDAASLLERLVDRITATIGDVIVVDLTMPRLAELGLWTMKALVPGAYPMDFDALWPHFGGRRMVEAPVIAGLLDAPRPFGQLNRVPHPFP